MHHSSRSQNASRKSQIANGFTLIEMLTTVAILIIVLGLMVSLARSVRNSSSERLTKNLLRQLDLLMAEYSSDNGKALPTVTAILPDDAAMGDENLIRARARMNNEDFVRTLRGGIARASLRSRDRAAPDLSDDEQIGELPISVYDEVTLRDAWGSPIVFMPREQRLIGMAPRERPSFFFSAGPDQKYLSRDDNLYSYESGAGAAK